MSKKIWIFLLALCLVCVSACALADTACEHKYDDNYKVMISTTGDCETKAIFKNTCVLCGNVKYYSDYAHTPAFTVVDPTCTEPAMVGYVCSICDEQLGDMVVVPGSVPAGHKLVELKDTDDEAYAKTYGKAYKEASCTEAGVAFKACSECTEYDDNGYYTEGYEPVLTTLPKKDHAYSTSYYPIPADCENDEHYAFVCACGATKYYAPKPDGAKAKGHNYELDITPATCVADGYSVMKCVVCDDEDAATKKVIALDSNAHKIVRDGETAVRDEKCEPGNYVVGVEKIKCADCGKALGYRTFEPTHVGGWIYDDYKEATCATPAQGKKTCKTCGAVVKATEPATGAHKYVEDLYAPANCKEAARYGTLCAVCYAAKPGTTVTYVEGSTPAEHDWNTFVYTEATCQTEGKAWATTCKNCDAEKNAMIVTPKKAHRANKDIAAVYVAATCTEPECYVRYCVNEIKGEPCGQIAESEAVVGSKALGHRFESKKEVKATCQADGYTVMQCNRDPENCKAVDEATRVIIPASSAAHAYEDDDTIVAANCATEQNAIYKSHCKVEGCSWVGYRTEAYKHDDSNANPPAASCKEDQEYSYTCANTECNATVKDVVKKINHPAARLEEDYTTDATCTEPAYIGTFCHACETYVEKAVVEGSKAKDHDMADWFQVGPNLTDLPCEGPTCVAVAYYFNICLRDGCGYADPVVKFEKTEHNFINPTTGKELIKKDTDGTLYKYCFNDCHNDYVKIADIEQKPVDPECKHILVAVAGKAPTCSVPGLTAGEKCVVCDKMIVEQEVIPTIDHTVVQLEGSYAATCTKAGWSAGKICTVCNTMVEAEKELPALGHKYNEDGICTVCGEKDPNFAENHDHVYTKSYSFNDDFTKRVVTYTCTKCDHTYSEEEDF